MISQSGVAADPLSGTSVDIHALLTVQQIAFWIAWIVAIPATAKWISWTRAQAAAPE